jgi:hypothetical protein
LFSVWIADGDYEAAVRFELLYQRWRDMVRAGGHDDRIEWSVLGPAKIAVALFNVNLGVAETLETS